MHFDASGSVIEDCSNGGDADGEEATATTTNGDSEVNVMGADSAAYLVSSFAVVTTISMIAVANFALML